jgi:hypothetical protein
MARWISEAQEVAAEEIEDEDAKETAELIGSVRWPRKWQSMMLEKLFGTSPQKESLRTRVSRRAREEEEMYMQVMAKLDAEKTIHSMMGR